MPTQKPKEGACDLAHLESLLKKIMELIEREAIHFKAADALKWAARTYLVAAISSVATLLYYILIFMNRNRD